MPIQPANKPYDPSQTAPGRTINTEARPGYRDHDDGPYSYSLNRPPKPGVSPALAVWAVVGALASIGIGIAFWFVYWR